MPFTSKLNNLSITDRNILHSFIEMEDTDINPYENGTYAEKKKKNRTHHKTINKKII